MSAANAQNVNNLRTRSSQQGGWVQDSSSSANFLNRDRGELPYATRPGISQVLPPSINSKRIQDKRPLSAGFPAQLYREIGPPHPREDPVRSVDKVFNAYGERLRADLRDMHGLCTQLVTQEKQEAAKWYALCAKVIMERDHARQRVSVLTNERNNVASTSEAQNMDIDFSSKRGRQILPSDTKESIGDTSAARSTSPADHRPLGPLRLSPVHSPPTSPSPGLSMSPPSSSLLAATPLPSHATSPPFYSRSEISPFERRPVKRRRSCDVSRPISYETKPNERGNPLQQTRSSSPPKVIKQQSRSPSPLTLPPQAGGFLASNFSHVDLMYVPAKGAFVCRACLLEKSKIGSFEPKVFPLTASWDELRDHCIGMHPEACADVARLQPAEIFELRRRLSV